MFYRRLLYICFFFQNYFVIDKLIGVILSFLKVDVEIVKRVVLNVIVVDIKIVFMYENLIMGMIFFFSLFELKVFIVW